jgi:hypothetical protein
MAAEQLQGRQADTNRKRTQEFLPGALVPLVPLVRIRLHGLERTLLLLALP